MDALARYEAKINRKGGVNACHPWTGGLTPKGYGRFRANGNGNIIAHRWGYQALIGPIPNELEVCHTCDNPPCQNARHWFLGTHKENMADCKRKGRYASGERHWQQKLNHQKVATIRAAYKGPQPPGPANARTGPSTMDLAKRFDVSQRLIWRIVHNEIWMD